MARSYQLRAAFDDDADRAHHRRLGFLGRRRHPGGPQDVRGAWRLRRFRHHRADRAEHQGVSGIHPVPAEFVTAQIDAVFSDLAIGAVKIGMVAQRADHRRHCRRSCALVAASSRARSRDGRDVG